MIKSIFIEVLPRASYLDVEWKHQQYLIVQTFDIVQFNYDMQGKKLKGHLMTRQKKTVCFRSYIQHQIQKMSTECRWRRFNKHAHCTVRVKTLITSSNMNNKCTNRCIVGSFNFIGLCKDVVAIVLRFKYEKVSTSFERLK